MRAGMSRSILSLNAVLLALLWTVTAHAGWAFPNEISLTEAYNTVYETAYDTQEMDGLAALVSDMGVDMKAQWTTADLAEIQILVFDSSNVAPIYLTVDGVKLMVYDPGPWTPYSKGWIPNTGGGFVDLNALLSDNGYDPDSTTFTLTRGDIELNANNTYLLEGMDPHQWILGYNDGGLSAGDKDANEPVILGFAPCPPVTPPPPAKYVKKCPDGSNIIIGTNGDDVIKGTNGDDCIFGLKGNDEIYGLKGNDVIRGGKGDDFLQGNQGNDDIRGGKGNDTIRGGKDDDTLRGKKGDDTIYGDLGNDMIKGGDGNDTIFGGNDGGNGTDGSDYIKGGAGDDVIRGEDGNDTLKGGQGNDSVYGGNGDDVVRGGAGEDFVQGNKGMDDVRGGKGNDIVRGGKDDDKVTGGAGDDVVYGDLGNDLVKGGKGNDLLFGGNDGWCCDGEDGDDHIRGGQGDDVLFGDVGNDLLRGGQGNDQLYGEGGDDELRGKKGDDFLDGGEGYDTLKGNKGCDVCMGGEVVKKSCELEEPSEYGCEPPLQWCTGYVTVVSDEDNVTPAGNAVATWDEHPDWTANIPGATWIWSSYLVENPKEDTVAHFGRSFELPMNAVDIKASMRVAGDNSYYTYINGLCTGFSEVEKNFLEADGYIVTGFVTPGVNIFLAEVINWAQPWGNAKTNPAGLLYRIDVTYQYEAVSCDEDPNGEDEDPNGEDHGPYIEVNP